MACSYSRLDPATGRWYEVNPPVCMKCHYYSPTLKAFTTGDVTMRYFYVNCGKAVNPNCNPYSGAFVASTTVCAQHLF